MKIKIGSQEFATKGDVADECRGILDRFKWEPEIEGGERVFLIDLLEMHPEAFVKIGSGIKRVFVAQAPDHPTNCFWIERTDGSKTDWSWTKCLHPPTHREDVLKAMREAVRDQVQGFKAGVYALGVPVICEITEEEIPIAQAHVDHEIPFLLLAERWLGDNRMWDAVAVDATQDGTSARTMSNKADRESWYEFHRQNATLRVVSAQANLRRKRKVQ